VLRFVTFTGWLAPIPLTIATGAVIEAELREQPGVWIRNVHRMACANSANNIATGAVIEAELREQPGDR